MKKKIAGILLASVFSAAAVAQPSVKGFQIVERKEKKQFDVLFDGKLMTAYCYYDSIRKPFLFPLNTIDGITVTRGYPLQPLTGERTDHPHHVGMWLNYESVNGLDFWNNSTAIAVEKRDQYGTIRHEKVLEMKGSGNNASLSAIADWIRPDEKVLLKEKTNYAFKVKDNIFFIDRTTTLTATDLPVVFKDVKDGMLGIRVARELEMLSKEPLKLLDNKGNVTTVAISNDEVVTGMYRSSEGLKGDSVWGTTGKWATLTGKMHGEIISIGIIDHPKNIGYPTYWHARGYGLFAANPLGRKIFSNGKEELNFSLHPGESVTFRYRVLIHSGSELTDEVMNKIMADFEKVK